MWVMTAVAVVGTVTSIQGQEKAAARAEKASAEQAAAYQTAGERTAQEYLTAGESKQKAAEFEAKQLRQAAGQTKAMSQIAAAEEIRVAKLKQSRALAVAAASGGSATDPNVLRIISGLAGEGELASSMQLFTGSEHARVLELQAAGAEYSGYEVRNASIRAANNARAGASDAAKASWDSAQDAAVASRYGAMTSLLKGAGSMASRFGSSGETPGMNEGPDYRGDPGGSFGTVRR